MRVLRIAVGVLLAAYGLFSLFPIYCNVAWKAGWWTSVPPDIQRMVPLWEATGWWMLLIWLAEVVLLVTAGWRLIRGRPAFRVFVGAMAAEAAKWATMKTMPAYRQAFTSQELAMDYWMIGILVLIGALIWWSERKPAAPAAA